MSRENLFNELVGLSDESTRYILCRLFGAFEKDNSMTSEHFFTIIEMFIKKEKIINESVLDSPNGGINAPIART